MTSYTLVTSVRCSICGGKSVVTKPSPVDTRHCCPHHGIGDPDEGDFTRHGIGKIGHQFEIESFAVTSATPQEIQSHKSLTHINDTEIVDQVRFKDYIDVELSGNSISMRAADRGVSEGAVRHNLSRARELLERSTGGC